LLYRDALFDLSLKLIPYLQKGSSHETAYYWNQFSTKIFCVVAYAPSVFFYVKVGGRPTAFYYLTTCTSLLFFVGWLKLVQAQPRPFWVSKEVQAFSCTDQYGNPSAHAAICVGVALQIWLDFARSDRFRARD
jgi:hypothetical protein